MPRQPEAGVHDTHLHAFGKRLRALRKAAGLTQEQLAERAGISYEHLNKLERGGGGPSFAVVCALALALDTEPASLFRFPWSPHPKIRN